MNRLILLPIAGLIILLPLIYFILKQTIGDIAPAVLPPPNIPNQASNEPLEQLSNSTGSAKLGIMPRFNLSVPSGFSIGVYAQGLGAPRDLEYSPEGVLLASIPNQGKIVALPDINKDGVADEVRTVVGSLNKPHGLAFYNGKLFIAEADKVSRYDWNPANLSARVEKKLFDIPTGASHDAHTVIFDKNGQMFVKVGSSCNVCIESHSFRATVITSDEEGNAPKVFAKGLRNAPFFTIRPGSEEIWVTEMGRDFLGDNLPPDEINVLVQGADYGWPFCYGNKVVDTNFRKGSNCENSEIPKFEIQAHSAPLGLTFINSQKFPQDHQGDLLVSYHGSWNRSVPTGYKVVKLNYDNGKLSSQEDFLTGFISGSTAQGRPVDLIFDKDGSLLVSDDKAGNIYIINYSQ